MESTENKPIVHLAKSKGKIGRLLTMALGALVILFVVFFIVDRLVGWGILSSNRKPWTAVFLTNGQVYFGHISRYGGNEVDLTNIYYLQANQNLQQNQQNQQQQPNLSLVKLGNELHGPVDFMRINKQHVMFTEEMKDDSQVVKSINEYNKSAK